MPKKKALIGVFHSPVGDSFSQKKKVFVGNVKHSKDEKNISLVKPDPSHNVYSDMDSVSGDSGNDNISLGVGNSFFFGLATNIPKAKKATSNLVFDSKIVKSQIEISVRKSFVLNINLNAIERKSVMAKTQYIRKIFSFVNGFGGTTTLSKFEEII
ncbi:hypothetical protein G9A89_020718 [Geosiphon pyriformis]|nr:hypothetical protein G9A89_020718 [Geosiphon pyriformis]